MATKAAPSNLIDLLESIWSGPLDLGLASQISNSPIRKLQDFLEQADELFGSYWATPQLQPGIVRPEIRYTYMDRLRGKPRRSLIESGLDLLLYVPEVVVDYPFDIDNFATDTAGELRRAVSQMFRTLALVRPLVKADHMRFTHLSRTRHPAAYSRGTELFASLSHDEELKEIVRSLAAKYKVEESTIYHYAAVDVLGPINVLRQWPGKFTPLLHGNIELRTYSEILRMTNAGFMDGKAPTLSKLANLPLPHLKTNVKQLVELRQSDELFAEWRTALTSALREVQEISESDPQWEKHARMLMRDGLEPIRAKAATALKKSRFLAQATSGLRGFTFAGLGAATGSLAVGGNLVGGIVGAAAAKSLETVTGAINALRERRRNRAVIDLVVGIHDED